MIVLQNYEMPLVLKGSATEAISKETITAVKKLIEDNKGEVGDVEEWGKKTLQYPIQKEPTGLFYLLNFDLDHKAIPPLGKKLRMQENVIRFLLIKKEPVKKVKEKKSSKKVLKEESKVKEA